MTEPVGSIIAQCARELDDGWTERIPLELGDEAPLYGGEGVLDSLALVQLVLAVEDAIEERFGVNVSLADKRAVSQTSSPFRTIGTLTAYVEVRLLEAGWHE
jgi:acyl carrier protein